MSPRKLIRLSEGVKAHRLSTMRLYGIVFLFLILAVYSIWKSERFQNLIQGVSRARLSEALGVPVSFTTVDLRVFPPSVSLADVRIGNDPALGIPIDREFLQAEEITIGGGVSLVGRQLRLGRIRAVRPRITLVQLADGRWNIPPGLGAPTKEGGLKLEVRSLLIQQGVMDFEGRQIDVNGRFEDLTAELVALPGERYRGTLTARRARVDLPDAEPLLMGLSASFVLDPNSGIRFEDVRMNGAFGQVRGTGVIENLKNANAVFAATAELSIEEVERIFRADLGFSGAASLRARIEIPPSGAFRISGNLRAPRVRAEQFTLEQVAATVVARPDVLIAEIEQAGYGGGRASGVFRIGNLVKTPQPMTLALEAQGISLERFFGDLGLNATGLSGSAELSLALRWGEAGFERAGGGGTLRITPGPAASLVRGRFGIPTGGGGALSVVNGLIGFEGVAIRFRESTLALHGGIRIGQWQPDFDFQLRSRDLTEVDRLFQNFLAATGGKPETLGLGGSGEVAGHLTGTWTDPEATFQLSAEQARYAGVPFGSVRGTVDMKDGAFFFRPLRIYDGDSSLSLEGMARYRLEPGRARFDLTTAARNYPLSRLLDYLDLDVPVEGRVTGSFPLVGDPDSLTGGGSVSLADAVVWGQRIPLITGSVQMTPGRFAIAGLSASLGGGIVRGKAAISFRDKTFEANLAGDGIAVAELDVVKDAASDISGKLSFQLVGEGSLDRPDLKVTASLSQASFFDHPVPEGAEPRLEATVTKGVLEGSVAVPQRWTLTARGDLFGDPAGVEIALDAGDLNAFLLLTPFALPPGRGGSLAVSGNMTFPQETGKLPTGNFTVTRARLDLPERPGVIATSGEVKISLSDGKLTFDEFRAVGEGTTLTVNGSLDLGQDPAGLNVAVSGPIDSSLVALALPEVSLSGRVVTDVRATGTLEAPSFSGSLRLENGKYRLTALTQIVDDIDGSIRFAGSRGELEARAKVGGGEVYAAGGFDLKGAALEDFRISIQGRRVALRYPEDLRLTVDADLVATGGPNGNLIRGEVVLLKGTYSRDFEVTLSDLLARSRPSTAVAAREPWKERTRLEVRVVSSAALELRNNLARLTAAVDLVARGTLSDPTLVGQILLDEGGRVTFRDVRYEIESATIAFANTRGFAPIVDIRARAELRGYELIVTLVGTWPRIQATFSSDPPLPDDTIVGLLLTGADPFARPAAGADTSGSLVSAAGGIVGGAATGVLTSKAQRLFGLQRFQIDPVFTSSGVTFTTTVGWQFLPNWLATYSQPLFESSAREPVIQVEGRLWQSWVVRAQRDENGIILLDFRRRQRF